MKTLEELRDFFKADRFATEMGIVIDSVQEGGAVCSVELNHHHTNAVGMVQGGVVFTLADFAFAVAANQEEIGTVTLDSTIHFLKASTGGKLTATAVCKHRTRSICLYDIQVTDDAHNLVATVSATGFIKGTSTPTSQLL